MVKAAPPDAGGAVTDFQNLTKEYKLVKEQLQTPPSQPTSPDPADELISELSIKLFAKMAKGIYVEIRNSLK